MVNSQNNVLWLWLKPYVRRKKELFSNVGISARTATRRIEEMSENLKLSQEDYFKKQQFFSIAIDESIDTTDTAQLAILVREIKENFHFLEELVELIPMKNTTTGADILKALLQCFEAKNVGLSRLVSITTDGAPSMVGKNKVVVSLLQKHIESDEVNNSITMSYSPGSIVCKGNKLKKTW